MSTDDMEIVTAVQEALAGKVGKARFDLWFGSASRFSLAGENLSIAVPNQFYQDWLCAHFRPQIEAACRSAVGRRLEIRFQIDDSLSTAAIDGADQAADAATLVIEPGDEALSELTPSEPQPPAPPRKRRSKAEAIVSAVAAVCESASHLDTKSACAARHDSQAPHVRRPPTLSSFVVSAGNRVAHASATSVVERPGQLSPLVICGGSGVGKSHLLEAIVEAWRRQRPRSRAVYLSGEQFTIQFVEAMNGGGLPSFRRKYRGVELLAIDDLQFFVGKQATKGELLHTINALVRDRAQLVFAVDRPLGELEESLGKELVSRLAEGPHCRIEPPDFETRLTLTSQIAEELSMTVPEDVLRHVAEQFSGSARRLRGALNSLHATAMALDEPITLDLAHTALADLVRQPVRSVKLQDIQKAVCATFGVEPAQLRSHSKTRAASHPRMVAMYLARKHTRSALSEIGDYFGRRSHSTVLSAEKTIDRLIASGAILCLAERTLSARDAVRHVEGKLAAG